jgi:Domain of unknown function (DUF4249)
MKNLFFIFFSALLFSTCIEKYDLNIDTEQRSIVVDGVLTDSLGDQSVEVSYSAVIGVGNDNLLTPIPGCTVRVHDDAGNSFDFVETEPGRYTREMAGEPGRSYQVEVLTPDGKTLRSNPTLLRPAPPLGEISYVVYTSQFVNSAGNIETEQRLTMNMNLSVEGMAEKPFVRWRADGMYEFQESTLAARVCYVRSRPDLNNIKIFSTKTLPGGVLFDEPFLDLLLDWRFARKYCLHVFQYAISEEEYRYWQSVDDVVNVDGSFFDPPPGTVRGNMFNANDPGELVVGYFSVSGVSYDRMFITPETLGLGFIEPKCGGFNPFRPRGPECEDCTVLGGSSTEKPAYWQ